MRKKVFLCPWGNIFHKIYMEMYHPCKLPNCTLINSWKREILPYGIPLLYLRCHRDNVIWALVYLYSCWLFLCSGGIKVIKLTLLVMVHPFCDFLWLSVEIKLEICKVNEMKKKDRHKKYFNQKKTGKDDAEIIKWNLEYWNFGASSWLSLTSIYSIFRD